MRYITLINLLLASAVAAPVAMADGTASELRLTTASGTTVSVTAVSPNVLRVASASSGETLPTAPRTLILPSTGDAGASVSGTSAMSTITTSAGIMASVNPRSGAVTIDGGTPGSVVYDSGLRMQAGGERTISLLTGSEGSFYGAGERGHSFNLRGDTLVMYNRPTYGYTGNDPRISQMNVTMPLFLSPEGFAIVFDDPATARLILGNPVKYITESPVPVSYYYVGGVSSLADVTEQLTSITGRQGLAPLWSLGYITSKYGYRSQHETVGVVDTLKTLGYPVDGVVLDLYWFGKEEDMGRLDWDRDNWPDPRKMLSGLRRKGVNVVPITEPFVLRNGKGIDNFKELDAKGMFVRDSLGNTHDITIWVGEGGMLDVSNPDTRAWLRNIYKTNTDLGVGGWWGDLGEPEAHPETAVHANGLKARHYHNMYGNDWSSIIYDLFREEYPDTRLFTLMRAGTTGLQRNSVFPWSGDVSRSWGGLEPQIRIMLNSGLSGLAYMSHDVGGFAIDREHPYDPELYVRWLQLGLFSPVLRTHSQEFAEPYKYPQHAATIERLIKDRYRWLPYNYTLAYENAVRGWPLVRPLGFHDNGLSGTPSDSIYDEFLWGRDVLVAPVLTQGASARRIVFPEGSQWVDFSDPNTVYDGGTVLPGYPAPLEKLPLFVRAGAFIPMADYKMENTGDYRSDRFTVEYFPRPGVTSEYTLYDDNHFSPRSIADGEYRLIHFRGSESELGSIEIEITSGGTYVGAPKAVDLTFDIHAIPSGTHVTAVEGAKGKVTVDSRNGTARATLRYIPGTTARVKLALTAGPRAR